MSASSRDAQERLRGLPAVDAVLRELDQRPGAAAAARAVIEQLREEIATGRLAGPVPDAAAVAARAAAALVADGGSHYPRVVNGTGVLLHTGLGRAPLPAAAAQALLESADAFVHLEVDEETGARGVREQPLLEDLLALTGAEAGTVVNNNAAAVLLILCSLADGKDVVVSRGELVEIGGGFRLPELMARSGARLVEVGTTNRTYASDYAAVLRGDTGALLRVHTSNFRILGFQHAPKRGELVALARTHGVPLVEDLGSGLLLPFAGPPLDDEPDVRGALAEGVDLVCFSADKLLGGPQAGLVLGRSELVLRCRRHPLFRALRPGRLPLAALAATLAAHRADRTSVPVLAALSRSAAERRGAAQALRATLAGRFPRGTFTLVDSEASAGSGSAPARPIASAAVEIVWPGLAAEELARRLRRGRPSVFGRLWQGRLRLDVLALLPGDGERLAAALAALESPG